MKIYISENDLRLNPTWSDAFDDIGIEISDSISTSDNALSSDLKDIKELGIERIGTWEYHDKLNMTKVDPVHSLDTIIPCSEDELTYFMRTHPSVFVKPRLSRAKGAGSEDPIAYRTFNEVELLTEIDDVFNFWQLQHNNGGNYVIAQYAIQEAVEGDLWYVKGVYNGVDEPQILLTTLREVTSQEHVWLYPNNTRQLASRQIDMSDDQKESIKILVTRFINKIGGRGFFQMQGKFKGSVPKLIDYTPTYPVISGLFKDSEYLDQGRVDRLMFNYAYGNGTLESLDNIDLDISIEWCSNFDFGSDDHDTIKRRVEFIEDNGNIVRRVDRNIRENMSRYYTIMFIAKTKEELDLKISNLSTQVLSI
jgi:hypothetical protein